MQRRRPFRGLQLKVEVVRKMIGTLTRVALAGKRGKTIERQIFSGKNPPHTFDERWPVRRSHSAGRSSSRSIGHERRRARLSRALRNSRNHERLDANFGGN